MNAKKSPGALAIVGGEPLFPTPVAVGSPNIGNREALFSRLSAVLDRRWLTNNGQALQELEQRIASYLGVEHCILVSNATVGLEVAARACGLTGDVLVPSMTFVATAHAMRWIGLNPIFCEIDEQSLCISAEDAKAKITPNTSAILGVHLFGRACEIDALQKVADDNGLQLLFDAAHTFGCSYKGVKIGNFGKAEVFSFHATKYFNTLEGGAITTNNPDVAAKVRLLINFGIDRPDSVAALGTNAKMNEFSAAMGLTNLDSLSEFVKANKRNYERYDSNLRSIQGIRIHSIPADEESNFQYVVARVDETYGLSRDALAAVLQAENVIVRKYFVPGCHKAEPYRTERSVSLPVTEKLLDTVLALPTGMAVSEDTIDAISEIIRLAPKLRDRLQDV